MVSAKVLDIGQAIIVRSLQLISAAGLVVVGYGVYSLKVLRHRAQPAPVAPVAPISPTEPSAGAEGSSTIVSKELK
jgi:hypothetical protein